MAADVNLTMDRIINPEAVLVGGHEQIRRPCDTHDGLVST